jgi:hypothetical protein
MPTVKEDIENVLYTSKDLVKENFAIAQEYAQSAFAMANASLQALGDTAKEIDAPDIDVTLDIEDFSLEDFVENPPFPPSWNFSFPSNPVPPEFQDIPVLDSVSFPEFTATLLEPDIPTLPAIPPFPAIPNPPEITDPTIPLKPTYEMPDVPALVLPTVPDVPMISFPSFDDTPPDASNLIAPSPAITDGGSDFTTIEGLKEKIEEMLKGDRPAFTQEVEDAILNRDLERATQIQNDTIDRLNAEWSRKRAPLPNGVLVAIIEEAELQFANKRLDTSREITVKLFELTQANIHKAIDGGVQLQSFYMNIADAIARRVFEASKAAADAMIASFNAGVKKVEILVDIYKTRASVYEIIIRAEIGKLEVYKTQIEAAKLTVDMNDSRVKIYQAQLSGIESLIGLYRAEMEGAKLFVDIQRSRLDIFRSQIEGYMAGVNTKTAEYGMYRAKIEGEVAKVEIFSKQADAYRSEVSAKAEQLRANVEKVRSMAEVNKALAERYSSEIEGFKSLIQGESARIDALVKGYSAEIEGYKATVDGASAFANLEVKVYDARVQALIAKANLEIKAAEIEIKNLEAETQLKIEAMKGMAQIASSLAIGALTAIHVSAGIDAKGAASEDIGYRTSHDENYNYNYSL